MRVQVHRQWVSIGRQWHQNADKDGGLVQARLAIIRKGGWFKLIMMPAAAASPADISFALGVGTAKRIGKRADPNLPLTRDGNTFGATLAPQ